MASTAEVEVEVEKSVRFAEAPAKEAAAAPEWWLKEIKGITVQDYGRSGACFLVLYVFAVYFADKGLLAQSARVG